MSIIELTDIKKSYYMGDTELEVLKDINFTIDAGEMVAIVGASGSGKSTLMNIIGLLDRHDEGAYKLNGRRVRTYSDDELASIRNKTIGFVFQQFFLLPRLTALQNVALPLRVTGASRSDYAEDAVELLRWVGLGDALTKFPATLSGGERQRVAIARAVIARPKLLIADEPTGNVDPAMGQRLLRLFTEMNRGGTTILIATHDQGLLNGIRADKLHLEEGQLTKGLSA